MKPVVADKAQIAFCGLYCGACKKFLEGSCPGCHDNSKASWYVILDSEEELK